MPDSIYKEKMAAIDKDFQEKIRIAQVERMNQQLPLLLERRQLLEEMIIERKEHNNKIIQINREKKEELYGTPNSVADVFAQEEYGKHSDAQQNYDKEYLVPVNIVLENGKEQTLFPYSREEINALEKEVKELKENYDKIFEERKKIKSQIDKSKREERISYINREAEIKEAYKFLTYLDTATTTGYPNLENLTEDEVLRIYNDFYEKRNEPGYRRIWEETMNRMEKNDREVILPRDKKPAYPDASNDLEENATKAIQDEPEVYGPPAPEGMVENPEENDLTAENEPKQFNNNSTTLLTEGQILALRNRGFMVPFNKPGQTKLTEEQIKAVNSAGISTVDLTEPGSKTVEELTGMKDLTQPEEKHYKVREYVETPLPQLTPQPVVAQQASPNYIVPPQNIPAPEPGWVYQPGWIEQPELMPRPTMQPQSDQPSQQLPPDMILPPQQRPELEQQPAWIEHPELFSDPQWLHSKDRLDNDTQILTSQTSRHL